MSTRGIILIVIAAVAALANFAARPISEKTGFPELTIKVVALVVVLVSVTILMIFGK